jgi:hypothetical protein
VKGKVDLGHLAFLLLGAGSTIPWNVVVLSIDFFASICPHYKIGQIASALAMSNMLCAVGCLSIMVRFRMEAKIPVRFALLACELPWGDVCRDCVGMYSD